MKRFDYSFLANGLLPANLINITSTIYSLKTGAKIRKDEYERIFIELEKIAVVQSVKSSNAIEGIVTSDERIEEIANQNSKPLNHDENEIAGYRYSLNEIHLHYEEIELSENTILRLHEIMMSYIGTEDAGKYRINENYIVEEDKDGNRKMRFKPLSAKETPEAMKQLILAYHDASNNFNINQLILIPCFILDFLCIHPFRDGNGRMSRLLTLLLYKNGFDVGKYISFEEQINNSKGNYYEALRLSSINWLENEHSYIPFIENFLSTLYMCYKELDKRFSIVNSNKITKKARIEQVVLNNLIPISKAEICKILPDVSVTTVEAVLGIMVKEGLVRIIGSGRNTKYIRNDREG
ncbi:MAG: Fic family protein [Clostridia bacterium]|nr:Fic family protein [Clostridia bacterium]